MRKFFLTAFALSALFVMASSSFALEKSSERFSDDRADAWNAAGTCVIRYYNSCNDWLWVWSGWGAGDQVGVCYTTCCASTEQTTLTASWTYMRSVAPSGYGFTGTIQVAAADANCCPTGANLAQQSFLPVTRWNQYLWGINVPSRFVVYSTFGPTAGIPTLVATDHPAAGPTGVQACGTCYPLTRDAHSYYYGAPGAPVCPGSVFNDGVCNAAMFAECSVVCSTISVEPQTWGNIKNLYR